MPLKKSVWPEPHQRMFITGSASGDSLTGGGRLQRLPKQGTQHDLNTLLVFSVRVYCLIRHGYR
jgi:hypothetical protein